MKRIDFLAVAATSSNIVTFPVYRDDELLWHINPQDCGTFFHRPVARAIRRKIKTVFEADNKGFIRCYVWVRTPRRAVKYTGHGWNEEEAFEHAVKTVLFTN